MFQNGDSGYKQIFDARAGTYNDACASYPNARLQERKALLDRLSLVPGDRLCDAPAGGGFVSDAVLAEFGSDVEIVCVEPSKTFSDGIAGKVTVANVPVDDTGLEENSFTAISSLAGLHHVEDRAPTFREWFRLLNAGGRLAVADVLADSGTARFLNGFIDQHVPGGHDGMFFQPGEFSAQLAEAGFVDIEESVETALWRFDDRRCMVDFCTRLFSIQDTPAEAVEDALLSTVGLDETTHNGVVLKWALCYAYGRVPN